MPKVDGHLSVLARDINLLAVFVIFHTFDLLFKTFGNSANCSMTLS